MRLGGRGLRAWIVGASLLLPVSAPAQGDGGADPGGDVVPGVVDVFIAAPPSVRDALEGAVALPGTQVRWRSVDRVDAQAVLGSAGPDATSGPRTVVWIDASRRGGVELFFEDTASDRFLERDVAVVHGFDEVAVETLAQVVESSVATLLSDARAGMSRSDMASVLASRAAPPAPASALAAPPPPPPGAPLGPPHRAAPSPWSGEIGVFFGLRVVSGAAPWIEQGPGVTGAARGHRGGWAIGAWASAQYHVPVTVLSTLAGARLEGMAARAGLRLEREVGGPVALHLALGGGADVDSVRPVAGSSRTPVGLAASRIDLAYATTALLGGVVRPSPHVALFASLLGEVGLTRHHFDVSVGGVRTTVVTPGWLRAGFVAGVAWD